MAQQYRYPSSAQITINAIGPNNTPIPPDSILIGGEDPTGDLTPIAVDASGNIIVSPVLAPGAATAANQVLEIADLDALNARIAGALVPNAFDQIDLTYVTVGNGIGQVETAVYKLASATVKTLTLSYDSSDRLSSVVAS